MPVGQKWGSIPLAEAVSTPARLAATRARSEKTGIIQDLLRRAEPGDIQIAVAYLSGGPRQPRIGVGGAQLRRAAEGSRAATPAITLREVDETLERIASVSGAGSVAERARLLNGLFSRATAEEAGFLARLLVGELRQGALAGLMEEAVAQWAGLPLSDVRRAMMLSGDPPAGAPAAPAQGAAGRSRFPPPPL